MYQYNFELFLKFSLCYYFYFILSIQLLNFQLTLIFKTQKKINLNSHLFLGTIRHTKRQACSHSSQGPDA